MSAVRLYDYWRSSASYRVRIALGLLGIAHEKVAIDLAAGEQRAAFLRQRNPQGLVPVLEIDGLRLTQSLAIIQYLDETRQGGLLPADAAGRARVRALSHVVAMDIHPICNVSVAAEVIRPGDDADAVRRAWMQHFIRRGLTALERLLDDPRTGRFCHGDTPGLADICLVPQLYNARRWGTEIDDLERIVAIDAAARRLPAFAAAAPVAPG